MGKFSKIKKYNLDSLSIDEKIKFLDKEMEKTGLCEIANSTSGMYSVQGSEPNPSHNAFKSLSHDGQPLGFSGADFHIFTEPIGGLQYSPPHPVTGERRRASSWFGIASGFQPVSANSDRQILWIFDQSLSGGFGRYFSLELTRGSNPFWGTWISTAFGTEMLVPYNSSNSPLSDNIKNNLNNLNINNFLNPDDFGSPTNPVLFQNDLGDPDFLPIDVAKKFIAGALDLAIEGLDFLRDRGTSGALDTALDLIASLVGADGAKNNVDDYMRKFIPDLLLGKNPPGSDKNNPRDASGNFDAETISDYEEIYNDYRKEKNGEKGSLDTSWEDMYSIKAAANTDIGGSTGTLDPSAGDGFIDNGDGTETLRKAFDFDRLDDMIGSDPKTGLAAALYGIYAGVPFVLGKGEGGKTPTMYMGITFDKKTGKVIPNYKPNSIKESLDESVKLGHFDPEALTVDIEDIRKGIMPEFPKKPPAEMIDGYSVKSKLAPKVIKGEPTIKVTKKDLAALHILKDSEIKELLQQIDLINAHLQKNPADLIHAQQRYPKTDIRLAKLNWKMDQMMNASKEYLDTQFPENQRLVDRIKKATKKTMELTNPEAYKNLNKPDMELMSLDDHMRQKRIVSRHFKKKRQSKSMFRVDMNKVKEKNRKVAEQKVAEWQEKRRIELLNSNEFEDQKYDWRKEIGEDFANTTQGMKVGQTFTHVPSGQTVTTGGVLGGVETLQTSVPLFGDAVPGPTESQYGLQGFAKPIDIMRRGKKKTEELNKELDSSEKYTKEIKADEFMKGRVEDSVDSALLSDLGYKSTEDILGEVGDVWTYQEYMEMMNAIGDKAAAKSLPIVKKILEYGPGGKHPGDVPISLIDALEAITNARTKAEDALARAWERYNKIPEPQGGFGGGQGNPTNRRGSAFNKDGSVNLGSKADMTYKDVTDALNAIADKYNKKRDPLYAAIRDRRAGAKAADKIDAYNRAHDIEDKAVLDAWDEYNKQKISSPTETETRPTGLARVLGGTIDALTGGLTDFDRRGGKPTGLSRVLAGTVDAITGQKTDLDQRGSYLQAIMKAGTKLPKLDKYQSGVNTMLTYDRFLHNMGKNNSSSSVKGSTPDNRIDITNEISKKDKNYVETELNKEVERTSKDKVLTFNNSLKALSKSDTTESDINDAKKTVQDIFAKVYLDKAGLVATFGGTGDPITGANPALPEVLNVKDRGDYYEVDFGKSYAFREGGSEPITKGLLGLYLKTINAEPDTVGSDTISAYVAPAAAKLGITGDDKYFKKKGDPYSLYNSPDMHYKVRFIIKKKKKRKVNESNTFSKIKKFKNKY